MKFEQTINTLNNLYTELEKQYQIAEKHINNRHYEKASETLSTAIGSAELQITTAQLEETLPGLTLSEAQVPKDVLSATYDNVKQKVKDLRDLKACCDKDASIEHYKDQKLDAIKIRTAMRQEVLIEKQFARRFAQLTALKEQTEPFPGVNINLVHFLNEVQQMKTKNSVSTPELTKIMDVTYKRLIGGPREEYDNVVTNLKAKHSTPLYILGATLALLGVALAAAAIFFAPAVITAATGLTAIYLGTASAATASSALSIGGAACFFSSTNRMKLADTCRELGSNKDFETNHYSAVKAQI
jgi:hypothetical protein